MDDEHDEDSTASRQTQANSQRLAAALAYILPNMGKHDRETLNAALVQAGHPPEAAQAVWQAIDYITANRGTYFREQLDAALVDQGWHPAMVQEIWAALLKADLPPRKSLPNEISDSAEVFAAAGSVVVRAYPGRTQADAARLFQQESPVAARYGYSPTSQSWGEGRPGVGRVVALGLFALAFKPKGFLTVTYTKISDARARRDSAATKICPQCAEEVKLAAVICRFCRYEF